MKKNNQNLAHLLDSVTLFPQVLLNIKLQAAYDWKSDDALQAQIGKVQQDLAGVGRVLIRASGTEPVLRVMVEARDMDEAINAAKSIASLIPVS